MKIKLDLFNSRGNSVFRDDVDEVIIPTPTGPIVILPKHEPILTAVETGLIRFRFGTTWAPFIAIKGGGIIHRYNLEENKTHVEIFLDELQNIPEKSYNEALSELNFYTQERPKATSDFDYETAEEKTRKARGILDAISFVTQNQGNITNEYVITRKF